ncbi:hypothetical protein HPB52_013354 [Rhipicephalus sanguineus]|uniref:Uncharacterized protein n=1 Tax=Rhipicephalus sanguineus TaxID=34632 RepID=A0A9D4PCR9_RHISA|nr:hypothetical protein HPB52_013354 [Rhipicephalus sanguineus]
MLPRLCPPVPPFHPAYPRAWFWQLDACLAVNGVTAQPLMHGILLDALPAELRHLSAASSSSPQPYDDLCAAVLARYGETYRPLPGTREFRVSPPSTRAVPPGPQPSHDHDLPSPATTPPTSRPATSTSIPAPAHQPDESTEKSVFSTASAHGPPDVPAICKSSPISMAHDTSATSGSTTATPPHALEPAIDTDIVTPAVRPPIAEASSAMSNEPAFSTSTLCASCQQELPSSSKSPAAEFRAPNHQRPNLRDAATMTEASEDELPGSTLAEQAAHVTPSTSAGIQLPDLRTSPRVPPADGASTRTGAVSEPAATTPARKPPTRHVATVQARCAGLRSTSTATVPAGISSHAADNVPEVRPAVTGIVVACATPLFMPNRLSGIGSDMQRDGRPCSCLQRPFVATPAHCAAPRAARQRPTGIRWSSHVNDLDCPRTLSFRDMNILVYTLP